MTIITDEQEAAYNEWRKTAAYPHDPLCTFVAGVEYGQKDLLKALGIAIARIEAILIGDEFQALLEADKCLPKILAVYEKHKEMKR